MGAGRALMRRASTWFMTWGLAIGLVQGVLQVVHGVLLDLGPGSLRDPGDVAAEGRQEAREVHRAFVIQFPPEGANREHHVAGLCEERLGVGDPPPYRPPPAAQTGGTAHAPPPQLAPWHTNATDLPHGTQPPQGVQARGKKWGPHIRTSAPTAGG